MALFGLKTLSFCLIGVGGVLAALGTTLFFTFDSILEASFKKNVNLDPKGEVFPNWAKFPIGIGLQWHFFHVVNPEEALNGQKVRVREVGPYGMVQWRSKKVLLWSPNYDRVRYYEYRAYHLDPANTVGSLDDEITVINPFVAVSAPFRS